MPVADIQRAYSVLTVKAVDGERRVLTGVATTPEADRQQDVVEPLGATFKNPLPLLLFHNAANPVGTVRLGKPTKDGIDFEAKIVSPSEPGPLKEQADHAWQLVKEQLVRGVSIGFRVLNDAMDFMRDTGGIRFREIEIMELSLVTIPANASATIQTIKSFDASHMAATGQGARAHTPGAAGTPVVKVLPSRQERQMKSIQEQILSYKSTRDQKFNEMQGLMTKAGEAGVTLDESEGQSYEALEAEVAACDTHIKRLESFQAHQKSAAVPVAGGDPAAAHAARGGQPAAAPVIRVQPNEAPGIGFTRAVMCKAASFLAITKDGTMKSALDFAKERYPDNDRLHTYLKATIPAGTSTDVTWASPLVYATNLVDEFVEFLRPMTIIGKFGQNGIPSLTRVPFNVRVPRQTSGGDAYWVGQGAPKPLTKFDFDSITMGITKVAAISVITEELARLSSPSAEMRVRDGLSGAVIARIDTDFIDPTQAAVTNVNPASITNGLSALTPSGTTADAARADFARIIKSYLDNNLDPSGLVIIMPTALALSLSIQRNSLGQAEFPGLMMSGGTVVGLPVITSQYAANQSGAGNMVIAVNAKDILLADDGQVSVDVSREASLQMLDNPTNSSATATATTMVSMFQTNSLAIRAERFINWTKARSTAVVYMDDVNWGSIGSPA
jgi:HK97 family phage major capsid protein/HK97 family phage prohead protease